MINFTSEGKKPKIDFNQAKGKVIAKAELAEKEKSNNYLLLTFKDGSQLQIKDEGQSCCEERFMNTDDNLNDLVGGKLIDIELKEHIETSADYHVLEIQFLEIKTHQGWVTIKSNNDHNGYYGGFDIVLYYKESGNEK